MNFDAIIIGAGNGGLIAALTMQKEGKKVLLLEKENKPGGLATSFIRGRFEFETSLHQMNDFNLKEPSSILNKLFKQLNLDDKIEFQTLNNTFHIITIDDKQEYIMPVDIGPFIDKMVEYCEDSKESMITFFEILKEITLALEYLKENPTSYNEEELENKYPNFIKLAPYSLEEVLNAINMPKKAADILSAYWLYWGLPAKSINFITYANMLYSFIINHPVIPKNRSFDISLTIFEEFIKSGGVAKFLTPVTKILYENNQITGVETDKGTYYSKVVIANISPNVVYGKLLNSPNINKRANQLINSRKLGAKGVCVYLGLNKSKEELGLKDSTYFIYHTLDSNKEYNRMKHLKGDNLIASVLNNTSDYSTPNKTTIITLTTYIFSDVFDSTVTPNNYYDLKNAFATNLINIFEEATNIKISDYIEEIEIATPITFSRYTSHPTGTINGYLETKLDSVIPRIMNYEEDEKFIPNLFFTGAFHTFSKGYANTYLSGSFSAKEALKYLEKEDVKDEN